jgi:hypothetical protein
MKVEDLVDRVGELLEEDFSHSALRTKAIIVEYLKLTLTRFAALTRIVDKHSIRVCGTADELNFFTAPSDFTEAFAVMFDQRMLDLVRLNDMDFVEGGWLGATPASEPLSVTQKGSGADALFSMTPAPTSIAGSFGTGVYEEVFLESPDGTVWEVTVNGGVLITTPGAAGTALTYIIPGPTTVWELIIDNLGVLDTTLTTGNADNIYLEDAGATELIYYLKTDDFGVLDTETVYGLTTGFQIDGTYQTFASDGTGASENYGVVVDCYATGVSTTPELVGLVDSAVGVINLDRTMHNRATLYYLGSLPEPDNLASTVFIHDAFVPVLEHGILALAYNEDGPGYDPQKAKILNAIFEAECESIRGTFGRV